MENEVCGKCYYVVCLVAVMFLLPHSGANLVISEPLHVVTVIVKWFFHSTKMVIGGQDCKKCHL